MTKINTLNNNAKKAIVYGSIITFLLLVALIAYLVIKAEERSRSFTFTSDPATTANYETIYRYGELDQNDYESLSIDFSGLENLTFDEIGNPSAPQENSTLSKDYGNIQIEIIYPKGTIYRIEGSSVSISDRYTTDHKQYVLTLVNSDSVTRVFDSYAELLAYLEPYRYLDGPEMTTFSMVTDGYGSEDSSIRLLSGGFGFTQYGFPINCEIKYTNLQATQDSTIENANAFNLQEVCPPNQAAFYPGLLDTIGFMDKIDFFIAIDNNPDAFPLIIDPEDAFAFFPGDITIDSGEINSYLFIIDSSTRLHLTAHNNFVNISSSWPAVNHLPDGRFSFPHATVEMKDLTGALHYAKYDRVIDPSSILQIVDGTKIRISIYGTVLDANKNPFFTPFYAKGLFEEIILNDKTIIKAKKDK
jgi:uncharacterized protein YqfB (UPF0267 family)